MPPASTARSAEAPWRASLDLQPAGELETDAVALGEPVDVVRVAETRQPDAGRGRRIRRSEPDRAA